MKINMKEGSDVARRQRAAAKKKKKDVKERPRRPPTEMDMSILTTVKRMEEDKRNL